MFDFQALEDRERHVTIREIGSPIINIWFSVALINFADPV